jgi:epoxyqueuosine reductase QueG
MKRSYIMTEEDIKKRALTYLHRSPRNRVSKKTAISARSEGLLLYEDLLFAVASADDPLFASFKAPEIIGAHFMTPREWLPEARSVISIFGIFGAKVRESNRGGGRPSEEWLHGRIEGHTFICCLGERLKIFLTKNGHQCVIPSMDKRFRGNGASARPGSGISVPFTSNWSERHVAFACGLGTFGLSKSLITRRGSAGRMISLITDLSLPSSERPYESPYEYCSHCGKCVKNCPVGAISMKEGKRHLPCSSFLDKTHKWYAPRYGCGKCQTDVPCERQNPAPYM